MVVKKSFLSSVKRSKCLKSMGSVKPAMGDGLMCGAVLGFLLGLAFGLNKNKQGEDLGSFALHCGIRTSVVCAFLFGIFFALRLAVKV